jgi:hypothetical protein
MKADVFGNTRECINKKEMGMKILLWLILFMISWPIALLALLLYPLIWILLLPFRLLGITVDAAFRLLKAILFLPARILGGMRA